MPTFNNGESGSSVRSKINDAITKVDAIDQGVATTDSPEFAGLTVDTDTLYVDSTNDRVGIGTSSPNRKFHVSRDLTSSIVGLFESANTEGAIALKGSGTTNEVQVRLVANGDDLLAYSGGSEAMRIDSSGKLLMGTASTANLQNNESIQLDPGGTSHFRALSEFTAMDFQVGGGVKGSIRVTTSSTSYNTSSDERLKKNIADAQPASDLIDGIQVREFDWKADGKHQRYGMVAQELETVAPEAVTKGETEDDMWAVDYSKLVPMLVKEIQDLRKRVNELEATT